MGSIYLELDEGLRESGASLSRGPSEKGRTASPSTSRRKTGKASTDCPASSLVPTHLDEWRLGPWTFDLGPWTPDLAPVRYNNSLTGSRFSSRYWGRPLWSRRVRAGSMPRTWYRVDRTFCRRIDVPMTFSPRPSVAPTI